MNIAWAAVISVFLLIVVGAITLAVLPKPQKLLPPPATSPTSFGDCIKYFAASSGYPRTCTDNLGQVFTENIGNAIEMADTIVVTNIKPGDAITTPVTITGKARGTYFFEGSFPVEIHRQSGTIVGRGVAEALQPWGVPDFVLFKAIINFEEPSFGSSGTIVLRNDNPSGDPSREKELDVPITFQ